MEVVLITGSGGLIGSEAVRFYAHSADVVVGLDNDMRAQFFGPEASTEWVTRDLVERYDNFKHISLDIRDETGLDRVFDEYGSDISLVVHSAAQPSHDWAARDPKLDFSVNANGTLNVLEAIRRRCPEAVMIFTSTNKVYGDTPNLLPREELAMRWELPADHPYFAAGIDETMTIDRSMHSLFGASKLAADVLTQEYGRYFGIKTGIFRGGCLTGPAQSGANLHGFLAYLMKCLVTGASYEVLGYKGKQVRDNIHSSDLISAFDHFYRQPRVGEVYNIGGGRRSNCSLLEAIELGESIVGKRLNWSYVDAPRRGDHIWWISDTSKFERHYPSWKPILTIPSILWDILEQRGQQWEAEARVTRC
ncbi:MAG: NAD-dependent epimerase/dehydratase family protein [Actinomycetota bacterium]|nr:NAD-dependent epimerase/dehydratase family protein [Actinomycetota bacterium]